MPPALRLSAVPFALIASCSCSLVARAELPPYVYGDQQRAAQAVVVLRVLQTLRQGSELRVDARVLAIRRQSLTPPLRAGQSVNLRYALPVWHRQGWVGPSPVPVLKQGQQVTAWLNRDPDQGAWFRPAAGGFSFGPSMEAMASEKP